MQVVRAVVLERPPHLIGAAGMVEHEHAQLERVLVPGDAGRPDPRQRVHAGALLRESQVTFGFLCLDDADTLQCLPRGVWSVVDRKLAIARRVG
jgi:hypothetical protein